MRPICNLHCRKGTGIARYLGALAASHVLHCKIPAGSYGLDGFARAVARHASGGKTVLKPFPYCMPGRGT